MKILEENIEKGEVVVQVENRNDLWHLYNIICKGDMVYALTYRRIRGGDDSLRPDSGERVPVYLGIRVEDVEFHRYSDRLRVKGIIVEGSDEVTRGDYHTINIEIGKKVKVVKEEWPTYILDRLKEAAKGLEEHVLIVAAEEGEAYIASIDRIAITPLVRISESIPGKRAGEEREGSLKMFYSKVAKSVFHYAKQLNPVKIIIAGPGLTKNRLREYIVDNYPELEALVILESASYGDESGVYEVIRRGTVEKVLRESRALREIEAIEDLLTQLAKNPEKVVYGKEQVEKAALCGAIHRLLIASKIMKDAMPEERKHLEELIKNIEKMRGEIIFVDGEHAAGQQLLGLGGIAAILRYPISEL